MSEPLVRCRGAARTFGTGAAATAEETVARLMRAVRVFAGGAPQSDDITILAVRRTDAPAEPVPGGRA